MEVKNGKQYIANKRNYRKAKHDTGFVPERHQILQFQGEFSTQNRDNKTELVKKFKYEKL
jgi:hypothetical protein